MTKEENQCCRKSISCGGALIRMLDGGGSVCINCVEKMLKDEIEQRIGNREIIAYEKGLAEHTDNEKKVVEQAMRELREQMIKENKHAYPRAFHSLHIERAIEIIDARYPNLKKVK